MQTHHRIALLTAGLLVGAQIGIAQMDTPIADSSDQMEPVPSETLALEGGTPGEPTEGQSEIAATPVEGAPTSIAAADEQWILPSAAQSMGPQGTAIPASGDDLPMLPALAAYLDRTEHLRLTGASPGFPASADELTMLPALASFLDQREATRIAARAQPQVAADTSGVDMTQVEASETTPVAQEPAREVSLLDRILPQKLRDLF